MEKIEQAIFQTLLYSDLFDFPLTKEELWGLLHSSSPVSRDSLKKVLQQKSRFFETKDNYIFLPHKKHLIIKRKMQAKEAQKKLLYLQKYMYVFSLVPTVLFVGVSGNVAVGVASKHDDIDLFVITKNNTLWITRLLLLFFFEILGVRQKEKGQIADTFCLNFMLSEKALSLERNDQDLFSAREITQLLPVYDRNNTYNAFLKANIWIRKKLPNAFAYAKGKEILYKKRYLLPVSLSFFLLLLEPLAFVLQQLYIKRKKTIHQITKTKLIFFNTSYKEKILSLYNKRLASYNTHV